MTWTSDQPDIVDGDTSGSFPVPGDGTPAPDPALTFPTGTVVQLTEVPPTDLPPGVDWSGLTLDSRAQRRGQRRMASPPPSPSPAVTRS